MVDEETPFTLRAGRSRRRATQFAPTELGVAVRALAKIRIAESDLQWRLKKKLADSLSGNPELTVRKSSIVLIVGVVYNEGNKYALTEVSMELRQRIFKMVHVYDGGAASAIYKVLMIIAISASLVPLITKEEIGWFLPLEAVCLVVFCIDYALRWVTADLRLGEGEPHPFLRFPLRLISVIDLVSVVALAFSVFGLFESFPALSALSVLRIVRIIRYSKSARTILDILKMSRKPLSAVGGLAVGYILVCAVIIFNVEPDTFNSFYDAVYWATVSLTTVGYGDLYPVSAVGRAVAMISSFFGIAIVALPAGIVSAKYLSSIKGDC